MKLSPAQSLVLLVLVGLSLSGWFYGVYWKRVASGSIFTREEKFIIRLQDQIQVLTEKNVELNEQISRLNNPNGESEEAAEKLNAPVTPGVTAPFEKIELPRKGF
ncbi:MAG: hypothetical protein P1U58_18085 [Verrucomicrobiales bacterium]|nr:hypothetical protein [Verrucomicrobiales bacterium]